MTKPNNNDCAVPAQQQHRAVYLSATEAQSLASILSPLGPASAIPPVLRSPAATPTEQPLHTILSPARQRARLSQILQDALSLVDDVETEMNHLFPQQETQNLHIFDFLPSN